MQTLIECMKRKTYHINKLKNIEVRLIDIIAFIFLSILGLIIRTRFFEFQSGDYLACLDVWTEKFSEMGFGAIAHDHYNYTPSYMYILYFISRIPIPRLIAIKLVSIVFDYLLSATIGLIVIFAQKDYRNGIISKGIFAYSIVLFTPTVIVNSAMWAQCDSIYVTFIFLCILFLLVEKGNIALLMYSVAFALKLQSIFFLPFLLFLAILGKRIKWYSFLYIPLVYLISIIPAWIGGRPIFELLTIYFGQAQSSGRLALAWPNIYYILGYTKFIELYGSAGVIFVASCLTIVFYYILSNSYDKKLQFHHLISIALFSVMLFTYFLPFMHERYGYLADMLAILYIFFYVKRIYVAVICVLTSYIGYTMYFTQVDFIDTFNVVIIPFLYLAVLISVGYGIYKDLKYLGDKNESVAEK